MKKGIGVSKGIGIGKIYILKDSEIIYEKNSTIGAEEELTRFKNACSQFIEKTIVLKNEIQIKVGQAEAEILEAHIEIINDPQISSEVKTALTNEGVTAEFAVERVFNTFRDIFASLDDELMSLRANDLEDIKKRVLQILTGQETSDIENINQPCILVVHDLTPSQTGRMDKTKIKGIIAEKGGYTSHAAIMARAMEIPAVLGMENILNEVSPDDYLIIDGESGEVFINPSPAEIGKYKGILIEQENVKKELQVYKDRPAQTKDGVKTLLFANIGGMEELEAVLQNGAEGIGLFRTEFLFMDRTSLPSEDEQFEVYKAVAEKMDGKPVIIRTMDIGGDKELDYLSLTKEENPFLGFRGIRMCLDMIDVFKVQLRAILRASAYGDIKIMLPMISRIDEIRKSKEIIETLKAELSKVGINYNQNIEIGIMVETPAAAVMADILAKESDFISIGTNDLTQYTIAVDRGNDKVSYLYETFNPAVLRLIANVISAGKKEGILVGMCGEAAGDSLMIPFLVGAGLDEFSMTASSILAAKKQISELSQKELSEMLPEILNQDSPWEVKELLEKLIN